MDYSPSIYAQNIAQSKAVDPLNEVSNLIRMRNQINSLPQTTDTMNMLGAGQPYPQR